MACSVNNNHIKTVTSARVSTPATLISKEDGKGGKQYIWRTDLMKTKDHWEDWFLGLSQAFLNVPIPKMLILAGSERMDKELCIAQMQGKFKLEVFSDVGHVIQEDSPTKLGKCFLSFVMTFRIREQADFVETVTSVSGKTVVIGLPH